MTGVAGKTLPVFQTVAAPITLASTFYKSYRGTSLLYLYVVAVKNQQELAEAQSMKQLVLTKTGTLRIQSETCQRRLAEAEADLATYDHRIQVVPKEQSK